jgi:GNAT superfamily N-acetyltransferase
MNSMTGQILTASTADDFAAFGALVSEYVQWCRGRYRDQPWFVDQVFGHQALSTELASLHEAYSAPLGKALLYVQDGDVCGGGAYRRRAHGSCEMKRLFVPDRFKGRGIGRQLCEAVIASARNEGYELMRLDTADLFAEAIALYEAFGFTRCAPYQPYPPALMQHLVFMELPLARPVRQPPRAARQKPAR